MSGRRDDGGYILVAVLGTMLLLAGLMTAGTVLLRSALHGAIQADTTVSAEGVTRSGLEIVAYQLFILKIPPSQVDGHRIRLTSATVIPSVSDEAGKIDLNHADPLVLRGLFEKVVETGTAAALVARIVALRGEDGGVPKPAAQTIAAPSSIGGPQTPPTATPPKLRGFQSVEQLRDFPDLTQGDLKKLAPSLTVFNPDGKVDILTASEEVLGALPGLSKAKIDDMLARRAGADKTESERLQAMLGEAIAYAKIKPGPAYTVRVASTNGAIRPIEAVIAAATKRPNEPFFILDWRE